MSQDVTKRVQVTFGTGLPLGTHGLFTHQGQRWIAFPLNKYGDICASTDRLIGALAVTQRELTSLLTTHPEDAERIGKILGILARADHTRRQAIIDKTEARTA